MDKRATKKYIKTVTGIEAESLTKFLRNRDMWMLEYIENIIDNKDVYRYVWNNLDLPYEMTYECVVDYEEFSNYPKFKEFLEARLDAYYKIDDGFYSHKEFSSERLEYIPTYNMREREIYYKLDDEDWKSYFVNKKLYEEAISDPFGFMRKNLNNFCIIDKETKCQVGIVEINPDYPTKRDWNISYMIVKEYRGKGYAQEAVNAVIQMQKNKHFFGITSTRYVDVYKKHNNCRSITGTVFKENVKSQNVLEKCGFKRTNQFSIDDCYTYIYKLK